MATEKKGKLLTCRYCGGAMDSGDSLCPQCGKPRSERPATPAKVIPFRPRRKDVRRTKPRAPDFPTPSLVRRLWLMVAIVAVLLPYLWNH